MTQAIKQFGEVQVKVAQEGIHPHHIGQGNTQVTTIFLYPAFQCRFLEITQTYVQRLKSLQEFMRHGTNRGNAQLFG